MNEDFQVVAIGVSAGGFRALHAILPGFSKDFPCPVIIVQHRMATEDNYLVESLNEKCELTVEEAGDKVKIEAGTVYIAPGDYHLLVEKNRTISLSVDEPVCYARPSIDVLFETAARAYGPRLIGIVLTGANSDGSKGVKAIKSRGGMTIAQAPGTAEAAMMPASAIATNCIDLVLSLEDIPSFVIGLLEDSHGRPE